MSMLDPGQHVAASILLRRVEAELGTCRRLLTGIETMVETMLANGQVAPDDPLHVVEAQNIDLLDQMLADLALFLTALAAAPNLGVAQPLRLAHLTRSLRLDDLRDRLGGTPLRSRGEGDVELF